MVASARCLLGAGLAVVLALIIEPGTAIAPGMMGEPPQPGKLFLGEPTVVAGLLQREPIGRCVARAPLEPSIRHSSALPTAGWW